MSESASQYVLAYNVLTAFLRSVIFCSAFPFWTSTAARYSSKKEIPRTWRAHLALTEDGCSAPL